tara:strand:+ start:751 stop:888 length:138 start_codon:yes stop_codon:yes gene_type:complete
LRQNSGNPEDENYKGPWAVYEGMEEYDPQEIVELTEDQQKTIQKY